MSNLTEIKLLIPVSDMEVHLVAHEMIKATMAAGQASNGVGSYLNKDPMDYHVRKGMGHILSLWHEHEINAREKDEPRLKHLYNAFTRLALAEVTRMKNSKPEKEILLEHTDE